MSNYSTPREHFHSLRQKIDAIRTATKAACQVARQGSDDLVTALEESLRTWAQSTLGQKRVELGGLLSRTLEALVASSMNARAEVEAFKSMLEGVRLQVDEEFDRCGVSLSIRVGELLHVLEGFRHKLSMAGLIGIGAPNAAKLDEHIAYWEEVKANLVDCWPWTDAPPPPVDREMVARSRAAFAAGEPFEDIDTLIERLRAEKPYGTNP